MNENIKKMTDLANRTSRSVIAVIDAMAKRGAFAGEELQTIGSLRQDCIEMVSLAESINSENAEKSKTK